MGQWEKAKKKAAEQVHDTAAELLHLYAQRAAREGHAFALSDDDYAAFAEGFGFDETPDQQAAIEAVIADMTSGKPMDRLVCGDVGFGKTEVALRAAFVAVLGGKQVAVLVPTTLLASQHFTTFTERFADYPVRVEVLSRFLTNAKAKAWVKVGYLLFVITAVYAVLRPDDTTVVANWLGVDRGADLLTYALVIAFVFTTLSTYLRFKELELRYARLARAVALEGARVPDEG